MKYVYPAVFHPEEDGGFCVYFPDIKRGATQGKTVAECIEMAEDFLCLSLYNMEEEKQVIPVATDIKAVNPGNGDIVTLISVNTEDYRRFYDAKLVKKNLNIPSWLNEKAEAANINFSQLLQRALKAELNLSID